MTVHDRRVVAGCAVFLVLFLLALHLLGVSLNEPTLPN